MFFCFRFCCGKYMQMLYVFSLKGFGLNGVRYFLFESCLQHYVLPGILVGCLVL